MEAKNQGPKNTGRKTDFLAFSASWPEGAQATNKDHIQKLLLELAFRATEGLGRNDSPSPMTGK